MRKWLLDTENGTERDDPCLDCTLRIDGELRTVRMLVVGTVGFCLQARMTDRDGMFLIREYQALDYAKWRRLWRRFAGDVRMEWEDGTPCGPGDGD